MRKSKATEALRVATDIAALKAALKKRGYTIRKRPKQAAWTITPLNQRGTGRKIGECYLLIYQPAPISVWVLHPDNDEPNRQTLFTLIQNTLAKPPTTIARRVS
jgi:hypothetical protein